MRSFRDSTELASAFEANESIRRLFMTCHEDSGGHVEHILRRLDARCSCSEPTEHNIKVTVEVSDPTGLHHLLDLHLLNHLLHSTRVIKTLVLRYTVIDGEDSALLCNDLALNQSKTNLSLIDCHFRGDANVEFIKFGKSRRKQAEEASF
jgi:hypothetical protein